MKIASILGIYLLLGSGYAIAAYAETPPNALSHSSHAEHESSDEQPKFWTSYPMLRVRMSRERSEKAVPAMEPKNISVRSVDAYSNDLTDAHGHRQLPLGFTSANLDKSETGGFHWITAREDQPDFVKVANTVYYFSDRGGKNPTAMFMQQKAELEIIPQPFPREHSRYRANEDWKFLVRFKGLSLSGQKLQLNTSNGTKLELLSDALGIVSLHVPDDFAADKEKPDSGEHNHGRRGADFVLASEFEAEGKHYLSSFNSSYGPDAYDQRSVALGLGFTFLGMLGAMPLLRQRKNTRKENVVSPAVEPKNNGEA